jgi:hypothetical protein
MVRGVRRPGLVLATISLALAAGPAQAKTVRVAVNGDNAPTCGTGNVAPCEDIGYALDFPVDSGDTVQIGPGDYRETLQTFDNVRLVGAGAGPPGAFDASRYTRIRDPAALPDLTPIVVLRGGGGVASLRIDGKDPSANSATALVLEASAGVLAPVYTVDRALLVAGELGAALSVSQGAPVSPTVRATVTSSRIVGDANNTALGVGGSTGDIRLRMADTVLSTTGPGISVSGGDLTLERSTLSGDTAVQAREADVVVDRSRLFGERTALGLTTESAGTRATVTNSLLTASPDEFASSPRAPLSISGSAGAGKTATLDLIGSTVVAGGAAEGALGVAPEAGQAASAALRGSVLTGVGTDLLISGAGGSATAVRSAFAEASGAAPAPGSGTNVAGNPRLAAGFAPLAGSPLIDRGDASVFAPGALDLAGVARLTDGDGNGSALPDIGAFEYVRPAAVRNIAPVLSRASLSNRVFAPVARGKSSARKRRVKRGTTFRYTLSEAATVTITIERKVAGRRVRLRGKRRCVAPNRSNRRRPRCTRWKRAGTLRAAEKAGRQSTAFSGRFRGRGLRRGSYRARIVAMDAAGARSTERRLSFRIVKP